MAKRKEEHGRIDGSVDVKGVYILIARKHGKAIRRAHYGIMCVKECADHDNG